MVATAEPGTAFRPVASCWCPCHEMGPGWVRVGGSAEACHAHAAAWGWVPPGTPHPDAPANPAAPAAN